MSLKFIHAVARIVVLFFLIAEWNSTTQVNHRLLTQSPTDEHSGFFQFFVIHKNPGCCYEHSGASPSLNKCFNCLGYIQRSESARPCDRCMFSLWETVRQVSRVVALFSLPQGSVQKFWLLHISPTFDVRLGLLVLIKGWQAYILVRKLLNKSTFPSSVT